MAGQSQAFASQLAINGQQMCFTSFKDNSMKELLDGSDESICGFLDAMGGRVTTGNEIYRFSVTLYPSPLELDVILPLIGFSVSIETFTLTDDFSSLLFPIIIDRVAKVHTYANCIVDKAIFRGQKGKKPISVQLDIIAFTESEGAAGSFSATALITPDILYRFSEGALTLESVGSRAFDRFALVFDNNVNAEANNSVTVTSSCPTRRDIFLAVNTPYTSTETDLYTTAQDTGDTATLAWSRATQSTSFAFTNVRSMRKPPDILRKNEIRLPLTYKAYRTVATAAVICTHDSTL